MCDLRSYWCVGFHLNCSNLSINRIKDHVAKYPYGYHEVMKLCHCQDDSQCNCNNNEIGLAII